MQPWLKTAYGYMGTKETPGPQSNNVILGWAKRLGGWIAGYYKSDEIPWCGLFVANCFKEHGMEVSGSALSALAWADWGQKSPVAEGAVLVFKRPGGGHVGFYVGEDSTAYHVLGGNQSDSVSIARVDKARLVAVRWPKEVHPPAVEQRLVKSTFGSLSRNEA
jgi:uncharacterized protein (TIGR02594 family)